MKQKNSHSQSSTLDTSAVQKLVEEAQASVEGVTRMTPIERKRAVKLRRGAHQVLPLIAKLASKYSVQAPGTSVDDIASNIAYAQSLEPLLGAVGVLQGTLSDAHLSAQSSAWKTGTVSYGMLKRASKANVNLASELAPVTEWFRTKAKGEPKAKRSKKTDTTAETPPAEAAEAQATPVAPAAKPNGVTAPVTTPTNTTAAASS
jgi:hypothetical protein